MLRDKYILDSFAIRFSVERDEKEVGRAYLYVLGNDLHEVPFGLLEDVYVEERYRGEGIGNELVQAVFARARRERCYKLIATSRNGDERKAVRDWYERLGFVNYGIELRMDL